jgi:YHS domain-containing protein
MKQKRLKRRRILLMAILGTTISAALTAGEINTDRNNTAIKGYDPVNYFLESDARKGSSRYSLEWKGATWYFSTDENRSLFASNPERYAPRFGGYCANGLSDRHKIGGNPQIWLIQEDELFFFFSRRGRSAWIDDSSKKLAAESYWKLVQFQ